MQGSYESTTQLVTGEGALASFGPLEIELIYLHQVNWSLLRAGLPFFNYFGLHNKSSQPCRVFLKFEVTAQCQLVCKGEETAELQANAKIELQDLELSFNYDLAFAYRNITNGILKTVVQLNWSDRSLRHDLSFPLQVLSGKEWCAGITRHEVNGRIGFYEQFPYQQVRCSITPDLETHKPKVVSRPLSTDGAHRLATSAAALVLPAHPAVRDLVIRTAQNIAPVTTDADKYSPLNLLSTIGGRKIQTEQIYTSLFHSKIYYSVEDVSFEPLTQRIRLPEEIFGRPATATCIDLALGVCAALSHVGLRPLLFMLETRQQQIHAIAGVWAVDSFGELQKFKESLSQKDKSALEKGLINPDLLGRLVRSQDDSMLLFDPTGVARKKKFHEAVQEAKELLAETVNDGRFGFALDLETTWKSVTPLPWFADPILRVSGFADQYLSRLKERMVRELSSEVGSSSELMSPQSIYVPLKGRRLNQQEAADLDILEHVASRVRDGVPRIVVLGNAGSGKSYFMGRLLLSLAEQYHKAPEDVPIPVLFPLKRFENQPNRGLLLQLQEYLQSFGHPIIPAEEFDEKVREGKFIILLDGLDELPILPGNRAEEEYLKPLSPLLDIPGAVVIITARSGLFAARAGELLSGFEALELSKWDESSWEEFLNQCVVHQVISSSERTELSNLIDRALGRIKELITKPLYCRMLIETRELLTSGQLVNEAQLFQLYTDKFISRHLYEHSDRLTPSQKIQCMQKTSFYMEEEGRRVLGLKEIADLLNRKYPTWLSDDDWQRYVSAIKVYGFLDNSLEDLFYFSHEAFREYFLATKFFQDLFSILEPGHAARDAADPNTCKAWSECGTIKLSLAVMRFVVQLLELQPEEQVNRGERLLGWIKQKRRNRSLWHGSSSPENLLRSLVSLRVLSGNDCNGLDLPDLDFSRLDLSRTDFTGSDLSGSSFVNSNLEHCVFYGANLTSADLSHSRLDGVDFRDANLMGAKFLQCSLSSCTMKFYGAKNLNMLSLGPEQRQQLLECLDAERKGSACDSNINIAWFDTTIDKIRRPS